MKSFGRENREPEPHYSAEQLEAGLREVRDLIEKTKRELDDFRAGHERGEIVGQRHAQGNDTLNDRLRQLAEHEKRILDLMDERTRNLGRRALED